MKRMRLLLVLCHLAAGVACVVNAVSRGAPLGPVCALAATMFAAGIHAGVGMALDAQRGARGATP